MSSHFFHRGEDDVERRRGREAVEPRVRLYGETDVRYLPAPHKSPAICRYLVLLAWQEFEPFPSVFESYYRYHPLPRPLVERGLSLLLGGAVRNGNVPSEAAVQLVHYLPENLAVRRCVFDPVEADVVMNHLVDDCVFHLSFRQVEAVPNRCLRVLKVQRPTYDDALLSATGTGGRALSNISELNS